MKILTYRLDELITGRHYEEAVHLVAAELGITLPPDTSIELDVWDVNNFTWEALVFYLGSRRISYSRNGTVRRRAASYPGSVAAITSIPER